MKLIQEKHCIRFLKVSYSYFRSNSKKKQDKFKSSNTKTFRLNGTWRSDFFTGKNILMPDFRINREHRTWACGVLELKNQKKGLDACKGRTTCKMSRTAVPGWGGTRSARKITRSNKSCDFEYSEFKICMEEEDFHMGTKEYRRKLPRVDVQARWQKISCIWFPESRNCVENMEPRLGWLDNVIWRQFWTRVLGEIAESLIRSCLIKDLSYLFMSDRFMRIFWVIFN